MTDHPVFSDDMREIAESFVLETQEIFDELNNDLLRLEQSDEGLPIIDKIFRAVHTVKGTSSFLSLDQLNLLAHSYEEVLNRLRRRRIAFHSTMMDVLFAAFDMMTVLLQQVLDGRIEHVPMDGLLDDLDRLTREYLPHGTEAHGTVADEAVAHDALTRDAVTHDAVTHDAVAHDAVAYHAADFEQAGGGDGSAVRHQHTAAAPMSRGLYSVTPAEEAATWSRGNESVRVSVDRLDDLLRLVGELVLSRNRIGRIVSDADASFRGDAAFEELTDAAAQLDNTTSRLQAAVLQTRMVPAGRVFARFQRVIRDLAKEAEKDVELVFEGDDTELDKSIIDDISDAFLHLIRNAVDHGIEPPDERRRKGKPPRGRITMKAEYDNGYIVIAMEDDGAGIDVDALRASAVERGFISEQATGSMSPDEITQLIFMPGLTTTDHTTRISGRGVGMDVVRTSATRLGGDVSVCSERGRGTCFTLRVPMTLSIVDALLVTCGNNVYAVPLRAVAEAVPVSGISTVHGRLVLRHGEEIVPLVDVADTLDLAGSARAGRCAIIVRGHEERIGLIVDRVLGQEQIVVKPLTSSLELIDGFSGAATLADGRVAMVLDVADVISMDSHRHRSGAATAPPRRSDKICRKTSINEVTS